MNNSKLVSDSVNLNVEQAEDISVQLRDREEKLIRLLRAIQDVSVGWSSLKDELFDPLVTSLEGQLLSEAKNQAPDPLRLNRLAGNLEMARRFADLQRVEAVYRNELTQIKKKLHGKNDS